ncbi:hypothetical protein I4U23_012176 [Adineta vaga]|nr:hypothetical protein I4U23_012176 [Adineta vaga]
MFYRLIFILFIGCFSISTIRIAKINNAHLISSANSVKFAELSNINSLYQCICQCLGNSQCLTATYYSFNQRCLLFSATIKEQWLGKLPSNKNTTVITRANETWIPCSKYNFQQPPTLRATGSGPIGAVSSDFNKDGHVDLAVSNTNANSISIFLGLVRTKDFNGDLISDLVVGNFDSNSINIFINNGMGMFIRLSSSTYTTSIINPIDIAIQDLDGDAVMDLAISNQLGNISTYYGYGNGTFGGIQTLSSAGHSLKAIIASDFDEDGLFDLAILNQDNNAMAVLLAECN